MPAPKEPIPDAELQVLKLLWPAERWLEICEAHELSAEEAAALAKTGAGREILYLHDDGRIIPLRRKPEALLTEADVVSATANEDPGRFGHYVIDLEITAEAAQRFAQETKRLSQQVPRVRLAILVPGKILSAPRLVSGIPNGKLRVTGNFSMLEAKQLAADLNAAKFSKVRVFQSEGQITLSTPGGEATVQLPGGMKTETATGKMSVRVQTHLTRFPNPQENDDETPRICLLPAGGRRPDVACHNRDCPTSHRQFEGCGIFRSCRR